MAQFNMVMINFIVSSSYNVHSEFYSCFFVHVSSPSSFPTPLDFLRMVVSHCVSNKFMVLLFLCSNSGSSSSGSSSSDSSSAFRSYKRLSGQSKGTKLTWIPAQCAQQPGSLDCGYYVMRFMYDIIMNHGNSQDLTKDFSRTLPYSPEEINEVKDFWANYFVNNVEFLA
ncbi:uncharacterized protein [Spinacia oleracea]|uniref:Uncharacterized protein isoform X1 n=1 Tax=Spinacia oleracea TaxID=3562 RepID=A0ABM3RH55_SPIOL|nr:uncharacterized protein LOC130469582 isoform X1 [Spinacia oleracea]